MCSDKFCDFLQYISNLGGIGDKAKLADLVKKRYCLSVDRSIYYCEDFAVRFSRAATRNISNTVLSLSNLKKYDDRPVISCAVLPHENYMLLCNTTCLKKISHSSQQLRVDNIRGSFNHSDIMKEVEGIENCPENFSDIFAFHSSFTFEENLERLVEATNGIIAHGHKIQLTDKNKEILLSAPQRAKQFLSSPFYRELNEDLAARTERVKYEIALAASIRNVNIKGNIIEHLITCDDGAERELMKDNLKNSKPLPPIKNSHDFGDYNCNLGGYSVKTDIKVKALFLHSNPKAYNIDKLLEFLSSENSVYLLYFVGIDESGEISTALCPVFDSDLLNATRIISHWAGRNSRGVAQFNGEAIKGIINRKATEIDFEEAVGFLNKLLDM